MFLGWVPGKKFGFIDPTDDTDDVFVHQNNVASPHLFKAGMRLTFDIQSGEKGREGVNVTLLAGTSTKRLRECVQFWNDHGYGFIDPDDGETDIFVGTSSLPVNEEGYLCEGDVVEFCALEGKKGLIAGDIAVIGWKKPWDHLAGFADMGPPGWLEDLAQLAEMEPWEYKHTTAAEPLPILRGYIRHTFQRLEEMEGGIGVSQDKKNAAFNTGLVTPNQEEIYTFFRRNPRSGRQPWRFQRFMKASDWDLIEQFGSSAPPLANYFDDPSVLLYDKRCELYVNIDHVMEQIERFPAHLQANPYVARQLLISAEATTKKRVYRNYKAAVPQYYRDKGGPGSVQLLLPICFEDPARADLALVVAKTEAGNAYRGSTVLTLDMAYNNARLLARPDNEWLQP
jgi:cold shock CspA family protein